MLKKAMLLATSAAALVAIAATPVQASGPLITNGFGEAAEEITMTSENTKIVTSPITIECQTDNQQIDLTLNAETTALGHGTGTVVGNPKTSEHSGGCAAFNGPYWHVDINGFHLTSHNFGETIGEVDAEYTIQTKIGSSVTTYCSYSSSATAIRTGENTLHVSGKLTLKPGGVPGCYAAATFTSDFTVRDEFGLLATIH